MTTEQQPERTSFTNILVRLLITSHSTKRLFGKPFIVYGKLLAAASNSFQMSGILACRFREHAQPFVTVFARSSDSATTVRVMTTEWVDDVTSRITSLASILDYVVSSEMERIKFDGDRAAFYLKYVHGKIYHDTSYDILQRFAIDGMALGLSDPCRFRELFEKTHSHFDEESRVERNRARAAGVEIPATPDIVKYDDCEVEAVEMFSDYCREIYPDFASSLGI